MRSLPLLLLLWSATAAACPQHDNLSSALRLLRDLPGGALDRAVNALLDEKRAHPTEWSKRVDGLLQGRRHTRSAPPSTTRDSPVLKPLPIR